MHSILPPASRRSCFWPFFLPFFCLSTLVVGCNGSGGDVSPTPAETPTAPGETPTAPGETPTSPPGPTPTATVRPATLELTPAFLEFPDTEIGQYHTLSVELDNPGELPLTLSRVVFESGDAAFSQDAASPGTVIAPGESLTVEITFAPPQARGYAGLLSFASEDLSSPMTLPMSGTGSPRPGTDGDGDGFTALQDGGADCNDGDAAVYPGAAESSCDEIDQDCNGSDLQDGDGDGSLGCDAILPDCDDTDDAIFPGQLEVPYDGIDQDCNGSDLSDVDGDGHDGVDAGGDDCDDQNANTFPGAIEYLDGADNNCDEVIDNVDDVVDDDGDGFSESTGDCSDDLAADPRAAERFPGASETPYDGIDQDCDGEDLTDVDGDGRSSDAVEGGTDCDDADPEAYPGASEVACDGIDQNCDGADVTDGDRDGYAASCAGGSDCDDLDPTIHPDMTEVCDGIDNNCDDVVDTDAADLLDFYVDADHDGRGDSSQPTQACAQQPGLAEAGGDCDDTRPSVYPGALEVCNGRDDDCDTLTDEDLLETYYADADGDSYGTETASTDACEAPAAHVSRAGDCDDARATTYPGATEVCNSIDDNCDARIDEGVTNLYFLDADEDGFGDAASGTLQSCSLPSGYAAQAGDCDDDRSSVNPSASEICNGRDDDCDGDTDEDLLVTGYRDRDSDGYGASSSGEVSSCSLADGYVLNAEDCDDSSDEIYPGAEEICNGIDDDCDTDVDEDVTETFFADSDSDGFGSELEVEGCPGSDSVADNDLDCDDGDAEIHPDALDSATDGIDQDCNGVDGTCASHGTFTLAPVETANAVGFMPSIAYDSRGVPHVVHHDVSNADLRYATLNPDGSWGGVPLDTAGSVGQWPSIEVDGLDRLHVAYYDSTNGDLKYRLYADGAWSSVSVDTSGTVGYYVDLAVDSRHRAHIVYLDVTNYDLKYATQVGSGWSVTTVDSTGSTGYYPSIAVDQQDRIHVSYYDASNADLRYGLKSPDSSWQLQTVASSGTMGEYSRIALDPAGVPHIAYYDASNYFIRVARLTAQGWQTLTARKWSLHSYSYQRPFDLQVGKWGEIYLTYYASPNLRLAIFDDPYSSLGKSTWWEGSVDTNASTGYCVGSALTPAGDLAIAYRDNSSSDLRFALYQPKSGSGTRSPWTSIVDTGTRPYFTSTAQLPDGSPVIAYYNYNSGDLNVAWYQNGWTVETVETTGTMGYWPSVAVDSQGFIHVAYTDYSNADLRYANNVLGSWIPSPVDTSGSTGYTAALALDAGDVPHIAYFDNTNSDLKYAKKVSAGWAISSLDLAGCVGQYPSIAIEATGSPAIAYFDCSNYDLKVARFTTGFWVTSSVETTGSVGYQPSIAVSDSGTLGIAYYDANSYYRLRYAELNGTSWTPETVYAVTNTHVGYAPVLRFAGDDPLIGSIHYSNVALTVSSIVGSSWDNRSFSENGQVYRDVHSSSMALGSCGMPLVSYPRSDAYLGSYYLAVQSW